MPRGGSASRKQQAVANQHNTKHENGLVGPGRKIQRERSNGHVNGLSKSSSNSRPSTPPVPSTPPANGQPRTQPDIATDANMAGESLRRSSLSAYSQASSTESYHQPSSGPMSQELHRQIDVNATKNPAVHRDNGPLGFAYTVLKSCPLYDTIAILIVLLQLPPTFLSIIHLLFATLTFVPPTSGHGFSFTDIFEGSIGTPSIATVIVVDMLVLLVWLFLWSPVQNFALDLAQTVIAMTLGGGTNGKEAGTNNVLVCLGVIGASHFARNGGVKSSGLRSLLSSSSRGIFGSDPDDPLEAGPQIIEKGAYTWARSILAIHILAQGVVRFVRQWYVRREKRDAAGANLGDPEAGKGSLTHPDTNVHDSNSNTPNGQIPDTENLCPLPTSNDKTLSMKKKRKHIAQVRTRQPLWAALASTKVVMVKEYETSHSAAESAGANATDINNLGSAPFNTEADRIWITYVGFDEVCFNTSYFPTHNQSNHCEGNSECLSSPGIDPSKPFFVRVNKSIWQPTRISTMAEPEGEASKETRWTGEIFGLAAMSNYECEFVSTANGAPLFSTSIRTLQAPKMGTAVAATISPAPQRLLQPDSPITTLKTSIAAAEVKLNEERNRQKRDRREQKTKLNGLRKELDRLANSIASSGNSDDRQRQKVQQSNLHMKQAEDALLTIISDIEALEDLPDDDISDWNDAKKDWRAAREVHHVAQAKSDESKQVAERAIQALNSELTTLQQKRERMQSRITKLAGEHERITDANARGLDEAQRREREIDQKQSDRLSHEMGYIQQLNQTRQFIDRLHETRERLWADIEALHNEELYISQAAQQVSASPNASMPNLGYEEMNSSYPWNPPAPNHVNHAATANLLANPFGRMRGRSSSMLSNVSGFTQCSDELARAMAEHEEAVREANGGSGSGNGSVGDPRSPAPVRQDEWI